MSTTELIPALSLSLLFALLQDCLVQVADGSPLKPPTQRANAAAPVVGSMVPVRGATAQVGIDAAQIPSLVESFGIDAPRLFEDEVPKHWVTVDDFYIDKYLCIQRSQDCSAFSMFPVTTIWKKA